MKFSEFVNEEINYTREPGEPCKLTDRWFYYNPDDDIIFGCGEEPVDEDIMFAFNPKSCKVIIGGEERQYDVSNPVCLFIYDIEKNEVSVYTDDVNEYLSQMGFDETVTGASRRFCNMLADTFEKYEDEKRCLLIYGNDVLASTFDIIEEN